MSSPSKISSSLHFRSVYNIKMENGDEVQICRADLRRLLREQSIPPKMQIKLKYLDACITGSKVQTSILDQLPQFQKISLQQMTVETQISLFTSIIRCLSGREPALFFSGQRATLRKEQSFSGWTGCLLTCDSRSFSIFKRKDKPQLWHEFNMEKLWVSKIYRQYKKKYVFGIAYDRTKYQLGFEDEATCSRIHSVLIDCIRQKKAQKQRLKLAIVQPQQKRGDQQKSELLFQKQQHIVQNDFNQQEYIEYQQFQYLAHLQERIMQAGLADDQDFQLLKNINQGKIMQNKKEQKIKIQMIIDNCQIGNLIETYIKFGAWNLQVDDCQIINRMRNNSYLAHLKLKKYSLLSYPREAYLSITYTKTCQCLVKRQERASHNQAEFNKHYLLISSVNGELYPETKGYVTMSFSQIVQLSQVQDSPTTVFMVISSQLDFNSYEYLNNNLSQGLHLMNDIVAFPKYYQERQLAGINNRLFNYNYCFCQLKQKPRKLSIQSDISVQSKEDQIVQENYKEEDIEIKPLAHQHVPQKDILQIISDYNNDIKNQDIIAVIENQDYQDYYLHNHFSQAVIDQLYKESGYTYNIIRDYLLQSGRWKISSSNDLVYCDETVLKVQKGVLKMILKQISTNLVAGKSIMNMSLPVQIFQKKSMLEVIAKMYGFFPKYMNDAVNTTNLVQQIKYVTLGYMCLSACTPNIQKPFNPILGETFQGIIGGIPIYLQQTFHHPPISSIYMKTSQFETYGNFDMHIDMGLNSAHSKVSSHFTVKIYKTKTEYTIKVPDVDMGGIMFGDRTFKLAGKGFVYEKTNDLYCEYSIGKQKKKVYEYNTKIRSNDVAGGVFKITNSYAKKLQSMDKSSSFDGVKADDIIERYSIISGKWYGDIFFDNVQYKSIQKGPFPVKLERPVHLLPSDCLFRKDIIYRYWNQNIKSNQEKEVLELLQRNDKKNREKYQKLIHK